MIHINESELKNIIRKTLKESLTKALREEMSPEDKWVADEEADEEKGCVEATGQKVDGQERDGEKGCCAEVGKAPAAGGQASAGAGPVGPDAGCKCNAKQEKGGHVAAFAPEGGCW